MTLLSAKEKIIFVRNIGDVARGLQLSHKVAYITTVICVGSNIGWTSKVISGLLYNCRHYKCNNYLDHDTKYDVNTSLTYFYFIMYVNREIFEVIPQKEKKIVTKFDRKIR